MAHEIDFIQTARAKRDRALDQEHVRQALLCTEEARVDLRDARVHFAPDITGDTLTRLTIAARANTMDITNNILSASLIVVKDLSKLAVRVRLRAILSGARLRNEHFILNGGMGAPSIVYKRSVDTP
eukprot:5732225-Pyramimonas_sp.AAC.1